jgi:hypothetical protein
MPSPDERLRERLAHLPDACRAILAAIDRARLRGEREVPIRFEVDRHGRIRRVIVHDREYRLRA